MISRAKFYKDAHELSAKNPNWIIAVREDSFGGEALYIRAVFDVPLDNNLNITDSPQQVMDCSDDEFSVGIKDTMPSSATVSVYICYSDAYRVPQLYFTGTLRCPMSCTQRSIVLADEWNKIIYDNSFNTTGAGTAAGSFFPIIGPTYSDELGFACLTLHQCDIESLLQMCNDNNVHDQNSIRRLIQLVGHAFRFPNVLFL
eukprot:Tbor_TRINITY_DN5737_c1_g9::TRINITY_DN5737_c1_g9_i1::g.19665::m.19665